MNLTLTERDKKLLGLTACLAILAIFGVHLIRPALAEQEALGGEYEAALRKQQEYQAQIDAAFAQGNIGKAKQIAESTEFAEMAERAFRLLRKSNELELYELVELIKELTAEKQNIYDYLDLFTMWFRDVLLFKATKEVDGLIFKDQYNYIKERAKKSSYEGIENIIDAIGKARERLHSNVNFDLVMELLFMTIREN